jgi:hypothetical protein
MGAILVGGKEAKAIERAQAIKLEIDRLKEEYEDIKRDLLMNTKYDFSATGSFVTKNGGLLNVTERAGTEIPPNPEEVMQMLKGMKKSKSFISIVQIVPKAFKALVGDENAKKLIKRKPAVFVWSFAKE